jgi:hypothetical protein
MRIAFPPLILFLSILFLTGCATSTASPTLEQPAPPSPGIFPTNTAQILSTLPPNAVYGYVSDENGPIEAALVREKATENKTVTGGDGSFIMNGLDITSPVTITAWAEGYFVGWVEDAISQPQPITINLKRYYTYDNPDYDWFSLEGVDGSLSCSHCMPCYQEWQEDAHSQSAVNPRFLTMYNGTDVQGNQSPLTRFGYSRDYGSFPLRPDPSQPYYGPGYKLDFPNTAGNCATCHIPAQAAHPGLVYAADPNHAKDIELEGTFCEFCHKIGAVILNPDTQLPNRNMPGILSMRLFRPEGEDQLFFGNFDDVTRRVSYLPLMEESAYCAPCHFGVFWDVVIYNSYGEWLDSPYSDPASGKTCQDCHMPPVDYNYFVYPEQGGLIRNPERIFSHKMPGASDETFLKNALAMDVKAVSEEGRIFIEVTITNDNTGHHIPTDSPLREMILLVEVKDTDGMPLEQLQGPTVPEWGGVGDPELGYYAGLPGKDFALILQELWTEVYPTGAYWNPVRIFSDTRLPAFASDISEYSFTNPEGGQVTVEVTLLFRRAFKDLMDQKGWDVPDIVMRQETLILPPQE